MEHHYNTKTEKEFSTFYIGNALCGISIESIQEINKQSGITLVPKSSDYVKGIMNLRGRIITIIDLGKKLALDSVNESSDNRNIIVRSNGEHIGLLIDSIDNIVRVQSNDIGPVPSNLNGISGNYFKGVIKTNEQLIGILDIDEVLQE